jgi:predicted ABC-type ATPase
MAVVRVASRVAQGGHDVPKDVVRRRFASGIRNFHERYKTLVDAWQIFDNAGAPPTLIDEGELT